jgi:hypothetical protein
MTSLGADLLALALLAASAGPFDNIERITPQQAVKRAEDCNLGRVTIRYEDDLQSDILTIKGATTASEEQLVCLDRATGFGIFVELPPSFQARFDTIREARASAMVKEEARQWLSARGLLNRVPNYVSGTTDDAKFAREVEKICGPKAEGAFQSKYGPHVLDPQWSNRFSMPPKPEEQDVFGCLFNIMSYSDFGVGFIGNEAYSAPKP